MASAAGLLLTGKGQAWGSEVLFEEVGADVPIPAHEAYEDLPEQPGNLDVAENELV